MHSSKYVTTLGFLLMLLLMLALVATGLRHLQEMQRNLSAIVSENNVKMSLIWDMRHAARERAMILHTLRHITDPFELDEMLQRFHGHARTFIQARAGLQAANLNPAERQLLDGALQLARQGEAVQQRYINLFTEQPQQNLDFILMREVQPIQEQVMAKLTILLDYQRQASRRAEDNAAIALHNAETFMLGLGVLVLLVGVSVATYVIRRNARIESDLHHEKERAEITLHSIGDAVITTDPDGRISWLNTAAERLAGWSNSEAMGRKIDEVMRPMGHGGQHSLLEVIRAVPSQGTYYSTENTEFVDRSGEVHTVEVSASTLHDWHRRPIGSVLVLHDVTHAQEMAKRLNWAASHDALTGLVNRTEFEHKLRILLESAKAQGTPHAILYMDLDQFKMVNDTCGHMAGDELLRQLSALLEGKIRGSDTLARLGGDEFGVLLEGCALSHAKEIAETLRSTVADYRFGWQDKWFDIGVSIGLAPVSAQTENIHTLLSAVDAACYVAKDKGRNQIHITEPGDEETYLRTGEMQWAQEVSQAIKEERLELYVQKIVPLAEGSDEGTHMELLLRMRDSQGKLIVPGTFIPAVERYGLMPTLDRWVIRTVFHRLAQFGNAVPHAACAINLSGQTLSDSGIQQYIVDQFERTGISPRRICFEITETAAVSNLRAARSFIDAMRARGCRFSLDDFGSGMSSFGYLRQLKVDYLKIDGTFVKDILSDPSDRAMVEAINNIGHVMGLQTIAEFVENDEIAAVLREIGVDYAQGYGIHKPEPIGGLVMKT